MPARQPPIAARAKSNSNKGVIRTNAPTKKPPPPPPPVRKPKTGRRMRQIFKGLTMTSVGTFPGANKVITGEDVRKFVTAHGGIYEEEVTSETTHLICSIEEYKKRPMQVRAAWQLGTERCQIVVFDWLEDCLVRKEKNLLKTRPYTLDRTIISLKKRKVEELAGYRKKFEDGVKVSKELSDDKLYHIYYDTDAFEYKVVLTRFRLDGQTLIEKYTLYASFPCPPSAMFTLSTTHTYLSTNTQSQLFESHNKAPPLYMFGAKFFRSRRPASYWRQDCRPMAFHTAFTCFKKFFKNKTGIDWDQRLERINANANAKPSDKIFFTYSPPINGRPVGQLPMGYVRPDDRPVAGTVAGGESTEEDDLEGEEHACDTDSEVDEDDLSARLSSALASDSASDSHPSDFNQSQSQSQSYITISSIRTKSSSPHPGPPPEHSVISIFSGSSSGEGSSSSGDGTVALSFGPTRGALTPASEPDMAREKNGAYLC